jgi:acetoin utilization deacetylase AcuC-like enzyme
MVWQELASAPPELIICNAGTDVLEGDRLGRLNVSPEGQLFYMHELLF